MRIGHVSLPASSWAVLERYVASSQGETAPSRLVKGKDSNRIPEPVAGETVSILTIDNEATTAACAPQPTQINSVSSRSVVACQEAQSSDSDYQQTLLELRHNVNHLRILESCRHEAVPLPCSSLCADPKGMRDTCFGLSPASCERSVNAVIKSPAVEEVANAFADMLSEFAVSEGPGEALMSPA